MIPRAPPFASCGAPPPLRPTLGGACGASLFLFPFFLCIFFLYDDTLHLRLFTCTTALNCNARGARATAVAGVARVAAGGQSERVGGVAAATVVSGEAEGSLHYSYTHHAAHHYMEAKFHSHNCLGGAQKRGSARHPLHAANFVAAAPRAAGRGAPGQNGE